MIQFQAIQYPLSFINQPNSKYNQTGTRAVTLITPKKPNLKKKTELRHKQTPNLISNSLYQHGFKITKKMLPLRQTNRISRPSQANVFISKI